MKWLIVAIFLIDSFNSASADVGGRADAQCEQGKNGETKCLLTYDLSDNPRRYYQLHELDRQSLSWSTVDNSQESRGKFRVQPEGLYRVLACDDLAVSLNCVSSSATWAPSLRPVEEIPAEMEVVDFDGSFMTVGFIEGAEPVVLLSQYNVYVLGDLVNRAIIAGQEDLPQMLPPVEPLGTSHRSLHHEIVHNTQSVYEGARLRGAE